MKSLFVGLPVIYIQGLIPADLALALPLKACEYAQCEVQADTWTWFFSQSTYAQTCMLFFL